MHRSVPLLGLLGLSLGACSGGGDGGQPPSSAADAGAPASTEAGAEGGAPNGSCTGEVVQCNQMLGGCLEQEGCELTVYGCSSSPPYCVQVQTRERCVALLGCTWESAGKQEVTPGAGTCIGDAVPCEKLSSSTECEEKPGLTSTRTCRYDLQSGICFKQGVEVGCGTYSSPSHFPAGTTLFMSRASGKGLCERTKGCSWQPEE